MPTAGLCVIPRSGHTITSEEPAAFNAALAELIAAAEAGRWLAHRASNNRENAMDLKLKGKTALVTGGSEGIGKGIALALAKEGVDVAICARRKEPLEGRRSEIAKATGRKIVAIPADLRKDKDAKNFIEQAPRRSAASTSWSTMPARPPAASSSI